MLRNLSTPTMNQAVAASIESFQTLKGFERN
jgi:hypothetical protein